MRRFAGSCRFVFNHALALQQERYAQGEKKLGYAGLCKQLTAWRNRPETAWLADAPVHPLQQALKDLERAYQPAPQCSAYSRATAWGVVKRRMARSAITPVLPAVRCIALAPRVAHRRR